jgi:3-isopropylmalate/(R)-2-methylmalate dehydratase small subunit
LALLDDGSLPQQQIDALMDQAERGSNASFTIGLQAQEIGTPDGGAMTFEVDQFRKHRLLNGLDDIGLSMQESAETGGFEQKQRGEQPWLYR